jgi:hypothetical protein
MDRTLLAAVIGAAGGFAVFVFNWLWLLYAENRTRIRIRAMLSIELEENLIALHAFSSAAQNTATFLRNIAGMQRRDQLAIAPLPAWKHGIWEGLLASIPLALREQEIRDVYQFHCNLDELTRLKMFSTGVASGHEWLDNFEAHINVLSQRGNPLKGPVR